MKFRMARHTNKLEKIINFYSNLLGLEILGSFSDHDFYDGVFLGKQGLDWHLEFTVSDHHPIHTPDEDDLLVFYFDTDEEYKKTINRLTMAGIKKEEAKNPYWNKNGILFKDPDGFGVIISMNKK